MRAYLPESARSESAIPESAIPEGVVPSAGGLFRGILTFEFGACARLAKLALVGTLLGGSMLLGSGCDLANGSGDSTSNAARGSNSTGETTGEKVVAKSDASSEGADSEGTRSEGERPPVESSDLDGLVKHDFGSSSDDATIEGDSIPEGDLIAADSSATAASASAAAAPAAGPAEAAEESDAMTKRASGKLASALKIDPVTGQPISGDLIPFGGNTPDPEALAKGLVNSKGETVPAPFEPEDPTKFEKNDAGFIIVGFSQIANFKYVEPIAGKPETLKKDQIPVAVKALNDQPVVMEGYMIPLEMDAENRVSVFFLARNTLACCQGRIPDINEVVEVTFDKPVKFSPDVLLRVSGKFEVGEVFDEFGYLMSVYRMKGQIFELPWK